jgi:hypothetical protein
MGLFHIRVVFDRVKIKKRLRREKAAISLRKF